MADGKERGVNYYMADGDTRRGPFPKEQLIAQGLRADTLVWCEGMVDWQPASNLPELRAMVGSQVAAPPVPPVAGYVGTAGYAGVPAFDRNEVSSKRVTAGVLGILLGGLGIHKFVLGMTGAGLIMLLVSVVSCGVGWVVMHVIGLIEGIIYLTKTDEEFYRQYIVEKKAWL